VNQDSAWRQSTQDAYRGVEYFARAFTGSYAESGQRSGHLSQQDAIVADRAIERDASRMIEGVRSEVFSGYRDSQERLDGLETGRTSNSVRDARCRPRRSARRLAPRLAR
jgi:hypothetical protein